MGLRRMDNVSIVVDDLDTVTAFFIALGMELEGTGSAEGEWADRMVGLDGMRCDVAMLRSPDGSGIELTRFRSPEQVRVDPGPITQTGYLRAMFQVDDIDETLDALRPHGGELVDQVVQYESFYRLCNVRGPERILIALAQPLS